MTDAELVRKRLAFIETCLQDLRREARPDRLEGDIRERRFVEHTLQLSIQSALDVASHVVSDERLGEPATLRHLFDLLAAGGWIAPASAPRLRAMAGFRNVLVHGYTEVDLALVRDVLEHHLGDLEDFVRQVRDRLGKLA